MTAFTAAIGTRTGDRHRVNGIPNQDYACYALLPNDMGIIAAVSDGAGSAPMAKTGSITSAQGATAKAWKTALRIGNAPDPAICVHEGIKAARRALEATARIQRNPLDDYHATIIVAAVIKEKAAVAHIGDGASIVRINETHKMLTIPARGQYANETFFITMDDYEDLIASNGAEGATELLLFTDGVQNELIDFRQKKARQAATSSLYHIGAPVETQETQGGLKHATRPGIIDQTDPTLCQWLDDGHTTHGDDATLLIIRATGRLQ